MNGTSGQSEKARDSVPEWLLELADDLDVYVAQRDFEEAVSLVEKNRTFWDSASPSQMNLHRDLKYQMAILVSLGTSLTKFASI